MALVGFLCANLIYVPKKVCVVRKLRKRKDSLPQKAASDVSAVDEKLIIQSNNERTASLYIKRIFQSKTRSV